MEKTSKTKIEKNESSSLALSISKTKIEKRLQQKRNPVLVETLIKMKKKKPEFAKLMAMPVKKLAMVNLDFIDKETKDGEKVFVPGKVLGVGELNKKLKIVAWRISESALKKIKESGSEFVLLEEEVKKDAELKGYKVLK